MFTNPGYNGICCNLRPCAAAQKINEVKNMFLSVILTIAAAYMALQCGLTAFSVPFASWTWLSWLYLAMAAVVIGVWVFAEPFTTKGAAGILLIVAAVSVVVLRSRKG